MSRKLNILIFNWQDIKNPLGGGAEVHLHEIFKRIAKFGHNVDLISCNFDDAPKNEVIDGVNISRVGARNTYNFYVPKTYKTISKEKKYDIIIDDINKIPFFTPLYVKQPVLAIAHHLFGESIYREANFVSASYVYLTEKLLPTIYFKTQFAVVSKSTKEELVKKGLKPENMEIIHNAIDVAHFPMKVSKKPNYPNITFFGRLKKYKHPDHLLKAFALFIKDYPNAVLNIAGRGDFESDLKRLSKELKIDSKTKFWGYITEEEKIELLSSSNVLVNTSMKEGWGITNLEANACGTPVFSADSPGLRDSVKKGVSGELYKFADIKGLNDLFLKLFQDKDYQTKLENGSIEWSKNFSWEKSAKEMENLIFKTIDNFRRIK